MTILNAPEYILKTHVVSVGDDGSVVVDSLFIVALNDFVFGPCFVMQYLVSFLVLHYLAEEERAGCFTFIVFLMSCDS